MCTRLEAVNDKLVKVRTTSDSNYYEYFLITIMNDKVVNVMRTGIQRMQSTHKSRVWNQYNPCV